MTLRSFLSGRLVKPYLGSSDFVGFVVVAGTAQPAWGSQKDAPSQKLILPSAETEGADVCRDDTMIYVGSRRNNFG